MAYYIGPRCSACHYCFNECPVSAIRFVGTSYEIDEMKCIGCGKCAEVCPSGIIYDPQKPVVVQKHDPRELHCDLVVLGAGGAGLVAAVRFAQLTGKKVVVLEKAKKPGGNTTLGHGFIIRYSKWHEKEGVPDGRQEFIDELYEGSGRTLKYELLKNATYAVSDMFDWLCTLGGVEEHFEMRIMPKAPGINKKVGPNTKFAMIDFPRRTQNVKSSDTSMGPGWMGTFVVEKMLEVGKELGMEVLTETKAEHLLINEDGSFCGVEASDPGGKVSVYADACVIATGGFAHDDERVLLTNPDFFKGQPVKRLSVAGSTGDGMKLVEEIGGQLDLEHLRVPASGPVHHPFNYTVMSLCGMGNPMVDLEGNIITRLQGGGPGSPTGPLDQMPGAAVYAIMDIDAVHREGAGLLQRSNDPSAVESRKNYLRELDYEASVGYPCRKAWTLEGLAEKMGINPKHFVQAMEEYNKKCQAQLEGRHAAPKGAGGPGGPGGPGPMMPNPVKTAPFYAVYLDRFSESASGGIAIDENLQVLRTDNTPIPGLYAVGDSCNGLFTRDDLNGKFGEMPWAMASGFMAGNLLAKRD